MGLNIKIKYEKKRINSLFVNSLFFFKQITDYSMPDALL